MLIHSDKAYKNGSIVDITVVLYNGAIVIEDLHKINANDYWCVFKKDQTSVCYNVLSGILKRITIPNSNIIIFGMHLITFYKDIYDILSLSADGKVNMYTYPHVRMIISKNILCFSSGRVLWIYGPYVREKIYVCKCKIKKISISDDVLVVELENSSIKSIKAHSDRMTITQQKPEFICSVEKTLFIPSLPVFYSGPVYYAILQVFIEKKIPKFIRYKIISHILATTEN